MPPFKEVRQDTLVGGLDTRNPSGSCNPSSYRLLINIDGGEARAMQRFPGWVKYGDGPTCYNNRDLHDQMQGGQTYAETVTSVTVTSASVDYCGPTKQRTQLCDESINFLKSVSSPTGRRRLMAGTRSRLYVNDDRSGNWRIIADGLGGACNDGSDCDCHPTHMKGASLGSATILTNNVDPVMIWEFDASVGGCAQWSADYVTELLALSVRTAEFVAEFQGFVFIANVIMDGVRLKNRILWSDFNNPTAWTPGGESLAALTDLGSSEAIVGMLPIGGKLRVYTDKAIYDGTLVGDSTLAQAGLVFAFKEVYRGTAVPKYKNTLIATKNHHYFIGEDEIYRMAEYDTEPTAFDWMHEASGAIFNGIPSQWVHPIDTLDGYEEINREACDMAVGGWRERDQSVWFSWPTGTGVNCPNLTMVLWPDLAKATIVDHGFTAFCEHSPDDSESLRDELGDKGLCDPADSLETKEGMPCPSEFVPVDYPYLWNETEDPDLPMGEDAFFAQYCNVCIEELCRTCKADTKYLMASADDYAIKQLAPGVFYREMLTSKTSATFPEVSTASYEQAGYSSLIQTDCVNLKTSKKKTVRAIMVGYSTNVVQEPPGELYCAVAAGEDSFCTQWETAPPELILCNSATGINRPDSHARYGFFSSGSYLAWRIFCEGIGSQFSINSVAVLFIETSKKW